MLHGVLRPYGNYFLPPTDDIANWSRKIQISKVGEARIVSKYLHHAIKEKELLIEELGMIAKKTNQQKRNQTQHKTITDWNKELKAMIFQELITIKTPKVKAQRIASKCVSVIKKAIS